MSPGTLADNTLVLFSSDNGPVWYPEDTETYGHSATGPLRGMKGDAYEGGHRMPFLARWPGVIPAGKRKRCPLICFTDLLATLAELTGQAIGGGFSYHFPRPKEDLAATPPQLYHLGRDLGQQHNLSGDSVARVERMAARLRAVHEEEKPQGWD